MSLLQVSRLAKSLIKSLTSILCRTSDSIHISDRAWSLCWVIVVRRWFFTLDNVENDLSPSQLVIWMVRYNRQVIPTLWKVAKSKPPYAFSISFLWSTLCHDEERKMYKLIHKWLFEFGRICNHQLSCTSSQLIHRQRCKVCHEIEHFVEFRRRLLSLRSSVLRQSMIQLKVLILNLSIELREKVSDVLLSSKKKLRSFKRTTTC